MSVPAARSEVGLTALLATDVAYFRVDADRNVTEISSAMERLTGFSAAEVVGRSCLRLHRCEECLKGCGVFDRGLVEDKVLRLYRADGTTVEVLKSGCVLRGARGEITGALEVIRPAPAPPAGRGDCVEAERIRHALERARFNRTAAARELGISRTSLWRKMKAYGI